MGLIRASVVLAKFGMCLLVVAPLLALGVMAVLDRGPDGLWRGSAFSAALVLFDPLTWDCLRHSAVVAGIVAVGSFVLGVPMARVLVRWQFWGRNVLGSIVCAPLVFPPLLGAFGLSLLFGVEGPSPFRALEAPASQPWNWGIGGAWFCWIGTGLIVGVPLVALATRGALERIDPSWEEAGRASGASSRRAWRTLVWSLVRPTVLRASALSFSVTLLEPGAPMILRLRGTLGYQIVEAATRSGSAPRATVLSVLGLLCAATVLVLVRLLSGPSRLDLGAAPVARPRRATWWRAGLFVAGLGIGSVLAWMPVLSVISHTVFRGPWTISEVSGHVSRRIGTPMVRGVDRFRRGRHRRRDAGACPGRGVPREPAVVTGGATVPGTTDRPPDPIRPPAGSRCRCSDGPPDAGCAGRVEPDPRDVGAGFGPHDRQSGKAPRPVPNARDRRGDRPGPGAASLAVGLDRVRSRPPTTPSGRDGSNPRRLPMAGLVGRLRPSGAPLAGWFLVARGDPIRRRCRCLAGPEPATGVPAHWPLGARSGRCPRWATCCPSPGGRRVCRPDRGVPGNGPDDSGGAAPLGRTLNAVRRDRPRAPRKPPALLTSQSSLGWREPPGIRYADSGSSPWPSRLFSNPPEDRRHGYCETRAGRWDGLHGSRLRRPGRVDGEVVFNTSMTGYQEILTDPSYHGQIVTMTYPADRQLRRQS